MTTTITPIIIACEAVSLAVVCAVLYGLFFENRSHGLRQKYFVWTMVFSALSLVFDIVCRLLDNVEGEPVFLSFTNCLALSMGSMMAAAFSYYVVATIKERNSKISLWNARAMAILNAIAIVMTIIGVFTGDTYVIVNNVFYEGPLYFICTYAILIALVYDFILVLRYRRDLGAHDVAAFCIYFILPFISALMQLLSPKLEFAYTVSAVAGLVVYIMLQSGHISELDMREKIMEEMSRRDTLTALKNRRAFDDMIEQGLTWDKVGVLYGDVNGLKYINDTMGHKAGDERLKRCAEMMLRYFPMDNVFRVSGDEIVVIQKETGPEFVALVKEIRKALIDEEDILSIGMAEGDGKDIIDLLKNAERGMYEEKSGAIFRHPEYYRR